MFSRFNQHQFQDTKAEIWGQAPFSCLPHKAKEPWISPGPKRPVRASDACPTPPYSPSAVSGSSSKRTSILSMRKPSITRAIIVIFVPS